jgi:hypothetical protein
VGAAHGPLPERGKKGPKIASDITKKTVREPWAQAAAKGPREKLWPKGGDRLNFVLGLGRGRAVKYLGKLIFLPFLAAFFPVGCPRQAPSAGPNGQFLIFAYIVLICNSEKISADY